VAASGPRSSHAGAVSRRPSRDPYRTKAATWTPVSADTRASTIAGVGPVVISDVLIASSATATVFDRGDVATVDLE